MRFRAFPPGLPHGRKGSAVKGSRRSWRRDEQLHRQRHFIRPGVMAGTGLCHSVVDKLKRPAAALPKLKSPGSFTCAGSAASMACFRHQPVNGGMNVLAGQSDRTNFQAEALCHGRNALRRCNLLCRGGGDLLSGPNPAASGFHRNVRVGLVEDNLGPCDDIASAGSGLLGGFRASACDGGTAMSWKLPIFLSVRRNWCRRRDSNPRPHHYE